MPRLENVGSIFLRIEVCPYRPCHMFFFLFIFALNDSSITTLHCVLSYYIGSYANNEETNFFDLIMHEEKFVA